MKTQSIRVCVPVVLCVILAGSAAPPEAQVELAVIEVKSCRKRAKDSTTSGPG